MDQKGRITAAVLRQLEDHWAAWTGLGLDTLSIGDVRDNVACVEVRRDYRLHLEFSNAATEFTRIRGAHAGRGQLAELRSAETDAITQDVTRSLGEFSASVADVCEPELLLTRLDRTSLYAYESDRCQICGSSGKVTCNACVGRGQVACLRCNGSGRNTCTSCNGASWVTKTCAACNGSGSRYDYVTVQTWNSLTNQYEHQTQSVLVTCSSCHGSPTRQEMCPHCSAGQVRCLPCNATGSVNCNQCQGGLQSCDGCKGCGYLYTQYTVSARVVETQALEAFDLEEGHWLHPLIVPGCSTLASAWNGSATTAKPGQLSLRRTLDVHYAAVDVSMGSQQATIRVVGPAFDVHDFDGVADHVLSSGVQTLGQSIGTDEGRRSLEALLASRLNGEALAAWCSSPASRGLEHDAQDLSARFKGFVGASYLETLLTTASTFALRRYMAIQARGLLVAVALSLMSAGMVYASIRWWPDLELPFWTPGVVAALTLVGTILHARYRSPLSLRLGKRTRAVSLVRRVHRFWWLWYVGYLIAGLGSVWLAMQIAR